MKKRVLALVIMLCMVISLIPVSAFAAEGSGAASTAKAPASDAVLAESGTKAVSEGTTVLAFTSDVHNGTQLNGSGESNLSALRMETWLSIVQPKYNNAIEVMGFCGDMAAASSNSSTFWTFTQTAMNVLADNGITGVYAVGNHEYMNGDFATTHNAEVQGKYVLNGEGRAVSGEKYVMYCLGTNSSHGTSWAYDDSQITSLTAYLDSVGNDKVIIILTHFPLHNFGSHRTSNTLPVLNAINNAAVGPDGQYGTSDDKKIVFLWGHNHSEGDTNYDQVWLPGDKINNDNNSTVYFYYAAAGSMADKEYGSSAKVLGKGLVLTINSKNQLSFTYYDASGNNVTEPDGQTITEQDPEPITSATVPGTTPTGTSGTVDLTKPVKVGRSVQLSVSVQPANSSYDVNWTSQNPEIAMVDNTGKVTGVSEGTATITVNIIDKLQRASQTLNVQITITAASGTQYVLTNTFEPGKEYIIASVNSGEGYALTNNNGSVAATAIEVEDEVLYAEDDENLVFTAEGSGTSVTDLVNEGRYLTITSSGSSWNQTYSLTLNNSANNRTWTYSSNRLSTTRSSSSTTQYYVYYSSSNGFTCSSNTSGTSSRDVYLYEKVEGPAVAVTGVTVSPASATVEARKTVKLTATVAPSDASNKKVTWSSSNTSVATVDSSGLVKGVAEGTVTITATSNGNPAVYGSCMVTVTASTVSGDVFVLADSIQEGGEYLIVNTSADGSGYALTNSGSSSDGTAPGRTAIVISDQMIETEDEGIIWLAETNESGFKLTNNGGILEGKSGNLRVFTTQQYPTRYWLYDGTYLLFKGGDYTYEVYYENSAFTARSFNSGDPSHPVYIFERANATPSVKVKLDQTSLTLKTGQTATLTATVTPSSLSDKTVTWKSSNTSVATVANGVVTAVGAGSATITATSNSDPAQSASCTITVKDPGEATVFTQTDTFEDGKLYLIAYGNSGTVYLVTNESGGSRVLKSLTATVSGGTITLDEEEVEKAAFTAEIKTSAYTGSTVSVWLKNGGKYLYTNNNDGLAMVESGTQTSSDNSGKVWHYKAEGKNLLWYFKDTSSSDGYTNTEQTYKYYLKLNSSNNFTDDHASTTSLANTTTPEIFLFTEVTAQVAVDGITLDKNTLTISAGDSATLTATITPSNATNKAVTWSSSNNNVATVENGVVTGVAKGTAIITATTADGGKTATCTVNVKEAETVTYKLAETLEDGKEYLIANGNTGSVYIVSTDAGASKQLLGVAATVADGKIAIAKNVAAKTVFTCESNSNSSQGGFRLKNGEKYLYAASTPGLSMTDNSTITSSDNRAKSWHYKADGKNLLWFFNDTNQTDGYTDTSSTYRYYLECSSGVFTDNHVSGSTTLANTTTPAMYLFVKDDGQAAPAGEGEIVVTANKTEVMPGQDVEFTIKLGPVTNLGSIEMLIQLPTGLTFKSLTIVSNLGFAPDENENGIAFTESNLMLSGYGDNGYTSTGETTFATFICTVEDSFTGGTVTLTDVDAYAISPWAEIEFEVTPVALTLHEHSFGEAVWNWADDHSSATVTFTCDDCVAETPYAATVNATVTHAEGTGSDLGYMIHTATVAAVDSPDGVAHTDIQKVAIPYSIEYSGIDGATFSSQNPTSYTVESDAITLVNPTKEGFDFAGWTGSNGTTPQTTVTIAKGSTGDRTYTANWTASGHKVSGSITSWVGNTAEGQVTVELFAGNSETAAYTADVTDNTSYEFEKVLDGEYTLKVSKKDHAPRTYSVTVDGEDVELDVEIRLYGDWDGDGEARTIDAARAYSHARGDSLIDDDYLITVLDVVGADGSIVGSGDAFVGDAKVEVIDAARIYKHARENNILW